MKPCKKHIIVSCISMFMLALCFGAYFLPLKAAEETRELRVLFTHDTHSHIDSFYTLEEGIPTELGGFSRIKTIIRQEQEKNPVTLVLDGGDFSMGTLTQTVYSSESAELRMLGAIGCDVATLGNHEFDYRSEGLVDALDAARESGDPIPALVLCNVDWDTMETQGLTREQSDIREAFQRYGVKDYLILEKGNLRAAVFGVFGKDSLACAPTCVLKFQDPIEAATRTVAHIKENEAVDIIICLSHSGTSEKASKSEDELLAKKVPDIDLIISGHSHTTLRNYIKHGNTYIGSVGEYGKNLGSLCMKQRSDGRWDMIEYEVLPVTSEIPPDPATQEKADVFARAVNSSYLAGFGYSTDQILAQNSVLFSSVKDMYSEHREHNLGNILSDAFLYTALQLNTSDPNPVDLAIVPTGCVRDTFLIGDVTVRDVYNAYSLGMGPDTLAGYPLISVYLTAEELKIVAEIDATISDLMTSARLHISGMNFEFNPRRIPLNKVTACYLVGKNGAPVELSEERLYRVVCDLYSGQMLGTVTDLSYGLIKIQPKFADGTVINNIEDAILYKDGQEVKAWAAIAQYLESCEDTDGDGIANIPMNYDSYMGRIVVNDSSNVIDILRKPNRFSIAIIGIVAVVLFLLFLLIRQLVKRIRKSHR